MKNVTILIDINVNYTDVSASVQRSPPLHALPETVCARVLDPRQTYRRAPHTRGVEKPEVPSTPGTQGSPAP